MSALTALRRHGYHSTKSLFDRAGFEFRRKPRLTRPAPPEQPHFYQPSATCQIRDLGLLYEVVFGQRSDGIVVEVGAFDGISYSNSSCLTAVGWKGLLIEPVPEFAEMCRERYAGNPNVRVCELAIGADERAIELKVGGPLTTANETLAEEYLNVRWSQQLMRDAHTAVVRQRRLDHVLTEESVPVGFDVLVVDVEGYEESVFEGFSVDRWRPVLMIVELADTHPDLTVTRVGDARLARRLVEHGYDVIYKDVINTIFVRRDRWFD